MKLLKKGDRIILDVETISGKKGLGTILSDQIHAKSSVRLRLDGSNEFTDAGRNEVTLLRVA